MDIIVLRTGISASEYYCSHTSVLPSSIMEKIGFDDYSPHQELISTFKLDIPCLSKAPSYIQNSGYCGLGWYYRVMASQSVEGKVRAFSIYLVCAGFDIGAVKNHRITISASPENIVRLHGYNSRVLPEVSSTLMASYQIQNPAVSVILKFVVCLPKLIRPATPVLSPAPPISTPLPTGAPRDLPVDSESPSSSSRDVHGLASYPKLKDVLQKSLQGVASFDDVQFVLFSQRMANREVGRPQILYASTELIAGHNAYLDASK